MSVASVTIGDEARYPRYIQAFDGKPGPCNRAFSVRDTKMGTRSANNIVKYARNQYECTFTLSHLVQDLTSLSCWRAWRSPGQG